MTIRIITDSACDLPEKVIRDLRITVVPLFINFGDKGYLDGVEISRRDFYTRISTSRVHPTTGAPGLETFTRVYDQLADEGADHILGIHISRRLSSTIEMAEKAASDYKRIPVTVRDSLQLSMGVGFQVETAARMAQDGAAMDDILSTLDDLASRSIVSAKLDTLKYLRRSGRMNAFMTGLGSLLQIKPIITMKNGTPVSERVRTTARAYTRLEEILAEHQPFERFAILHSNAAKEAEDFRTHISQFLPAGEVYSREITPVIGAHVGPGVVGFAGVSKKKVI